MIKYSEIHEVLTKLVIPDLIDDGTYELVKCLIVPIFDISGDCKYNGSIEDYLEALITDINATIIANSVI